jgi:hypothetical protein
MSFSLIWLPAILRGAGLKVIEAPGWQTCGHGDFGPARGVLLHHTAGCLHERPENLVHTLALGRPDLPGPIANLGLEEDGTYYMIAAGRAYHAGLGEYPGVTTDNGNHELIGIEAANTGAPGDVWEPAQLIAYRRGVAAILKHIGAQAIMAIGHKEWARPLGRKTDPDFSMDSFRASVGALLAACAHLPGIVPT